MVLRAVPRGGAVGGAVGGPWGGRGGASCFQYEYKNSTTSNCIPMASTGDTRSTSMVTHEDRSTNPDPKKRKYDNDNDKDS